jgi:hypothetical protein
MRSSGWTALFAAATGLVFAACGDKGGDGQETMSAASASSTGQGGAGGHGGAGTADGSNVTKEFCGAVAGPFCGALFTCCTAKVVLEAYGGTAEACLELLSADCLGDTASQLAASIAAGHTALDTAQLDQCVKTLEAMSEGGAACDAPPRVVLLTDCLSAYRGQIAPGAACSWSPSDLSFVHCKDGLCQQGSCVPFPATGAACSESSETNNLCNYTRGEWCLGEPSMSTCGPRGDIGAACNHPGSTSYECKSGTCGQDGTCAAPTAGGICESAG